MQNICYFPVNFCKCLQIVCSICGTLVELRLTLTTVPIEKNPQRSNIGFDQ